MNINAFLFFIILFFSQQCFAITLVYNMRIRRVFTLDAAIGREKKSKLGLSAVPIIYKRDRTIDNEALATQIKEKRLSGGSLFNIRYLDSHSWWIEATTGIEKERLKSRGSSTFRASRTGFDDIVIAGGYNLFPHTRIQLVFFGIAGFPTRTKVTLRETNDPLVGSRLFSAGFGSEFSYNFINTLKQSLIAIFQTRFLHFFNRSWQPILPVGAKIQPGNVTDILAALQYRYKKNFIETGYNPTIFTQQAVILPQQTTRGKNFVRHSVYASYAHVFTEVPLFKRAVVVGAGLNIGRSDRFKTKIIAGWLNLGIVF